MDWLKKILQDQGVTLTDEQFEALKKAAPEHVVPKTQYNTKAEEAEGLKKQLEQRDTDMASLKKDAGGNEELKKQLSDLQKKYKDDGDAATAQLAQVRLDSAVDLALAGSGARSVKAVRALLDMSKAKLDGEQLLGVSEQIEVLRKDQGYLFAEAQGTQQQQQPGYLYQPKAGDAPAGGAPATLHEAIAQRVEAGMAGKMKG